MTNPDYIAFVRPETGQILYGTLHLVPLGTPEPTAISGLPSKPQGLHPVHL